MRIGAAVPTVEGADGDLMRDFARVAEESGLDSLWVMDHVVMPADPRSTNPRLSESRGVREANWHPEALTTLSFLAGCTRRIRLAAGVLVVPMRNPVLLAKELATLALLSGGRLVAGIGVGWLREEFEALGASFVERGARTDEYVALMRHLWSTPGIVEFHGRYYSMPPVHFEPRPPGGRIPVVVGGHSGASIRRAATLGDGWYCLGVTAKEVPALRAQLHELASAAGRTSMPELICGTALPLSPGELERASDLVAAFEAAGADELVVYFSRQRSPRENVERIRALARDVVAS
jgi:probable F420-dependent oxidoreductase